MLATDRPLVVAHILQQFGVGGMEQGVAKIANGSDSRRVRSVVFSLESTPPPQPVLREAPKYELGRTRGNDPRLVLRLARGLARTRPDIVHTHAWGTLLEGYLAARLARIPYLIHGEHGTMEVRPRNLRVQGWLWRRFDRMLAVSDGLADRLASMTGFPRERITTIRNGVDCARFGRTSRENARKALNLADDDFVVGIVGRLVPVKDHLTFLDAIARIHAAGVPVVALIAGDGPLRGDLETASVERGLERCVRFLGHCVEVENVLPAFDVYVQTSLSEGMPNTPLEAMASGVPVIASDVGGTREVVGPEGFLVPSGAGGEIADRLLLLHAQPQLRRELAARARARAGEQFDIAKMVRAYEDLYWSVAAGRGAPQASGPSLASIPAGSSRAANGVTGKSG